MIETQEDIRNQERPFTEYLIKKFKAMDSTRDFMEQHYEFLTTEFIEHVLIYAPCEAARFLYNHPLFDKKCISSDITENPYGETIEPLYWPFLNKEDIGKLATELPAWSADHLKNNPIYQAFIKEKGTRNED